jgi:hypothetical protein
VGLLKLAQETQNRVRFSCRRDDSDPDRIGHCSQLAFAIWAKAQQAPHWMDIKIAYVG